MKKKKRGKDAAETVAVFVEKRQLVKGPDGRVYARFEGEAIPLDSERLLRKLAHLLRVETGIIPSDSLLKRVVSTLYAKEMPRAAIPVRFGWSPDGALWIDCGGESIAFLRVTKAGVFASEPSRDIVFTRPAAMRPYPVPEMPASDVASAAVFDAYRRFLGLSRIQLAAVVTWQLCAMRPMQDHTGSDMLAEYPILKVTGEEGAGKTTTADFISRAVDPQAAQHTGLPRQAAVIDIAGENQRVLAWDNTTHIGPELQDALARRATGDANAARALYTNRDQQMWVGSNPVIVTSIADALTQPDVLSRTLSLCLERRAGKTRDELNRAWEKLAPRYFGALLYALSRILRELPTTRAPRTIRMQDSAKWALAATTATGIAPKDTLRAFRSARAEGVAYTLEQPLPAALLRLLREGGPKAQTAMGWLTQLRRTYVEMTGSSFIPKTFPETAMGLASQLKRLSASLRAAGVIVTRQKSNGARLLHIASDPVLGSRPSPKGGISREIDEFTPQGQGRRGSLSNKRNIYIYTGRSDPPNRP